MTALSKAVTELATAQKAEENRVAVEARAANEAALRKEWGADYERSLRWVSEGPSEGLAVSLKAGRGR
jgi:hypothetical protein